MSPWIIHKKHNLNKSICGRGYFSVGNALPLLYHTVCSAALGAWTTCSSQFKLFSSVVPPKILSCSIPRYCCPVSVPMLCCSHRSPYPALLRPSPSHPPSLLYPRLPRFFVYDPGPVCLWRPLHLTFGGNEIFRCVGRRHGWTFFPASRKAGWDTVAQLDY